MSLLLIAIWLGYETYVSSQSITNAIAHSFVVLVVVFAYEFCRLALLSKVPNALKSITLYPFGGLSNSDRSLTLEHTQSEQSRNRSTRLACIPPAILGLIALLLAYSQSASPENEILHLGFLTAAVISVLLLLPVTPFPGGRLFLLLCKDSKTLPSSLPGPVKLLTLVTLALLAVQSDSVALTIIFAVYIGIAIEQHLFERSRTVALRFNAKEAMIPLDSLIAFTHTTGCSEALDKALLSFQNIFPVFQMQEPIGFVEKNSLLHLSEDGMTPLVSEVTSKTVSRVSSQTPLSLVMSIFRESEVPLLFVFDEDNNCLGILIKEKVLEFLVVRGSEIQIDSTNDLDDNFS